MPWVWLFALVLSLGACSQREFRRNEIFAQIGRETEITNQDSERILNLKPQLPNPFSVAVYFAPPKSQQRVLYWAWSNAEKKQVVDALSPLVDSKIVRSVVVLNPSTVGGEDLVDVRLAAARHGADAVLVVRGGDDGEVHTNRWAYLYAGLITTFFVPGNDARALFIAGCSLWDVRNEYLYLSAEGEAEAEQNRPAVFIDLQKVVGDAKSEAVRKMAVALQGIAIELPKTAQVAPPRLPLRNTRR